MVCNSGECLFEAGGANAGDCMVGDLVGFREKYGEYACYVGGLPDDEESEQYIAENEERFDAIYRRWERERIRP